MKNKPKYLTVISSTLLTILAGCVSTPTLEGAKFKLTTTSKQTNENAQDNTNNQFRTIDLVYELDPKDRGECRASYTEIETQLACAFKAFNHQDYYNDLDENQKSALAVTNITALYSEKQLNKLLEKARQLDELKEKGYFNRTAPTTLASLQSDFLENEYQLTKKRIEAAERTAQYLEFQRQRRNSVLARIMSASDAACDEYKRDLNRTFSNANFTFGSVSTITGGLGALATNATTARSLSGLTGITSGTRAEFNDAFFRNKVVELLTKAMDISRERKREEIRRRTTQIAADYSVEDSVNDAIIYNSKCTLVAGLQETSDSLKIVSDPGLRWLANAFGGAASNSDLTNTLFKHLGGAVDNIQKIQKATEDQNAVLTNPMTPAQPAASDSQK